MSLAQREEEAIVQHVRDLARYTRLPALASCCKEYTAAKFLRAERDQKLVGRN
jgi:hypothetical protein